MSQIIPLIEKNSKPFSAADIETMDINNIEVPVTISIKTKNISKIFLIDHIKLLYDLNTAI